MFYFTLSPQTNQSNVGMEVADVMMIEDREVIFFTQGVDYVAPLLADGEGGDGGGSSFGLPAVVGAYRVRAHWMERWLV